MTNILIIGPGAVGLSAGAALIDAGHAVTFAARQAFAPLRVNCTGEPARDLDVTVVTDPAEVTPPDWVLLCVKAHQVQGAADWLNAAAGEGTRVAILQNGVEHVERVEPLVPNVPLVPVVVDIPAGRYAPGGAVLALTGQPMRVFHKPGVADIARAILSECVAVGRAEGAKLPDSLIEAQMAKFMEATPDDTNSMYDDRAAGRETEWDARNAVIVRKGRKHGISTPVSDLIVPLLAAQH